LTDALTKPCLGCCHWVCGSQHFKGL